VNEPQESPQPASRLMVVADVGQMADEEIEVFADVFIARMIAAADQPGARGSQPADER